jgi:hypothetical protein
LLRGSLVAALLALLVLWTPAPAQEGGAIEGKVVNATQGGGSTVGLEVTLNILRNEGLQDILKGIADDRGTFRFAGLDTSAEYDYQVIVNYKGVEYTSDVVNFASGEKTKTVDVKVYEPTEDPGVLKIHVSQVEILLKMGTLVVVEQHLFSNPSDRTYIGARETGDGRREVLRFSLPPGARLMRLGGDLRECQYDSASTSSTECCKRLTRLGGDLRECCALVTSDGIVDTTAVKPGSRLEVFMYSLKYSSPSLALTRAIEFPTDIFALFIEDRGIQVIVEGLSKEGSVISPEGVRYLHFSGRDLKQGKTFVIRFPALPSSPPGLPSPHPDSQKIFHRLSPILLIIFIALALGYPMVRKRRQSLGEELIQELARLDDDFEAGKLDEAEYRRLRAEKKDRALSFFRGERIR